MNLEQANNVHFLVDHSNVLISIYSSRILVEKPQNKHDEAEALLPILCDHELRPAGTTMNQEYLGKAFPGITATALASRVRVNTRLAL